jgi:PAS domain-containing protein
MGGALTLLFRFLAPFWGELISRCGGSACALSCWCSPAGDIVWASRAFRRYFNIAPGFSFWSIEAVAQSDDVRSGVRNLFCGQGCRPFTWITQSCFWCVTARKGRSLFWASAIPQENKMGKASNALFDLDHKALECSSMLVVSLGRDGEVQYTNESFQELQKKVATPMGSKVLPFGQALLCLAEEARDKGGCVYRRMTEVVHSDKYIFDFTAFLSLDGYVLCCGREAVDALDELPSFQKRKRSAERLLRGLPMGVAIFDAQQKLVSFNHAFSGMFCLEEPWLEAGPSWGEILDVFRNRRILSEVLDFASYKDQFTPLFQNIERSPHQEFIHLAGECTIRMVLSPHPFSGCVVFFEDVTEKMRLKRRRHEMSLLLNAVTNQSDQGLLVLNSEKRVFLTNQSLQKLWSMTSDLKNMKDQSIFGLLESVQGQFYSKAHRHFFEQALASCLASRVSRSAFILLKGGKVLYVHYAPLPNGDHLFKFSDMTLEFERYEAKKEAFRLISLERIVFSARLNSLMKTAEHQSVYENDLEGGYKSGHSGKWVSSTFLAEAVKEVRRSLSDDYALLRDNFLFSDVLDDVLFLFDGLLTDRKLKLQLLGEFDVSFVMNRVLLTQFLWRAIGYALYEALPGSLVTLGFKNSQEGAALYLTSQVSDKDSWAPHLGVSEYTFRPWGLGMTLLSRLGARLNCKVRVLSCHRKHLSFACQFSRQSVETLMPALKQAS